MHLTTHKHTKCLNRRSSPTTRNRRAAPSQVNQKAIHIRQRRFSTLPTELIINGREITPPETNQKFVGISLGGITRDHLVYAMDQGYMPGLKRILDVPTFSSLATHFQNAQQSQQQQTTTMKQINYFQSEGHLGLAAAAFPTRFLPNSVSIVTGVATHLHGVIDDVFLDPEKSFAPYRIVGPTYIPSPSSAPTTTSISEPTESAVIASFPRADSILAGIQAHLTPEQCRVSMITPTTQSLSLVAHQLARPDGQDTATTTPLSIASLSTDQLENSSRLFSLDQFNMNNAWQPVSRNMTQILDKIPIPARSAVFQDLQSFDLLSKLIDHDTQTNFSGSSIYYVALQDTMARYNVTPELSTTSGGSRGNMPHHTSPALNAYLGALDTCIDKLHAAGIVIGITSTSGINAKTHFSGQPNILWVKDILSQAGIAVHMPSHKRADGLPGEEFSGYAMVHLDTSDHPTKDELTARRDRALDILRQIPGCYSALGREDAAAGLFTPLERTASIVLLGDSHSVFGTSQNEHTMNPATKAALLKYPLQSNGSLEESIVPLFFNRPLRSWAAKDFGKGRIRNFDLFPMMFNSLQL